MLKIYFDTETTGTNPYCDEIIEAYFQVYDGEKMIDEYLLQSRPLFWSADAEQIHNIPEYEARGFPKKETAFRDFLKWLPSDFQFYNYANLNTPMGIVNFDVCILWNELNLLGCDNYFLQNKKQMQPPVSVHPIARKCGTKRLFTPVKKFKNKGIYAQENVYFSLFNETYNAHRAKPDVIALVKMHNELIKLQDENRAYFNWN